MPFATPRVRLVLRAVIIFLAAIVLAAAALAVPAAAVPSALAAPPSITLPAITAAEPWEPLGGPDGGFVLSLAVSRQNPEILYLGSDVYGGAYRSTDGGQGWAFRGLLGGMGQVLGLSVRSLRDRQRHIC